MIYLIDLLFLIYLVNAPNRMMKHNCKKISTGMCVDIPFGFGSAISAPFLVVVVFENFWKV